MRFLFAAAALLAAVPASATHYLVDTGVGTNYPDAPYLYGFDNTRFQFVAIGFDVATPTVIRSIEGTLAPRVANTTLTIKLYTVDPTTDAPLIGGSFFSQAVSIPDGNGFHGVSGIAVPVAPGSYYAAFEVADGQTFNGYDVAGAPNPQAKEASEGYRSGGYHRITNRPVNTVGSLGLGLRIADEVAAVPEPAAWSLLVAGFGLVGAVSRRHRKRLCVAA